MNTVLEYFYFIVFNRDIKNNCKVKYFLLNLINFLLCIWKLYIYLLVNTKIYFKISNFFKSPLRCRFVSILVNF